MSTTKSATQSKLEQARAEHAARKATTTHESEPDFVHAAAIEDIVEASPNVYRKAIAFISSIFAAGLNPFEIRADIYFSVLVGMTRSKGS